MKQQKSGKNIFKGKYIVLPEGSWALLVLNNVYPIPKALSLNRVNKAFQGGKYNNLLIFPNNRMYRKAIKAWLKAEGLTVEEVHKQYSNGPIA